jgi:hypothetical protein
MDERSSVKLPIWMARAILVVIFVPALAWSVISRTWSEVSSIPKYVWWDWCADVENARNIWRTGEIHGEEDW